MAVDLLGGVFSILSLVFKSHFDVTAAVAYTLVVVSSTSHLIVCSVSNFYMITALTLVIMIYCTRFWTGWC